MTLERGASGAGVRELQRGLNRMGALLLVDGEFGGGTEAAVVEARAALGLPPDKRADATLLDLLRRIPDPSPELTAAGVTFIAREEISSPDRYRRVFKHPVWPTAESGITIGIGYDLQFADARKLRTDWGGALPDAVIGRLTQSCGTAGSAELLARVRDVEVPLLGAVDVFLKRMLPEHIAITRRTYPALDRLPPWRRTALVSLVFNRGGSLAGERRREMKRIGELLAEGQLDPVADQLEAMTRLWDPARAAGVIHRRRREAQLWRSGFGGLSLD